MTSRLVDPGPASASSRNAYLVVGVLASVYTLNFLDRQVLSILAEPVKRDLGLSDTQLGALTGLAFAVFYTVFGLPVAILADRWNRVRIISIACGLWSVFTAACGLATGFTTLALARVGVGIGEAGCSPPSYSIMSDYFPPERRGRAFAIYVLGVPLGSLIGAVAAGAIAARFGWRAAFIATGGVGLIVAPLIPLLVREPLRGRMDVRTEDGGAMSLLDAFHVFRRSPALTLSALASGMTAFVNYGMINWAPAFLMRDHGVALSHIAGPYGATLAGSMVAASWLSAVISDRFGARHPSLYALLPGIGMLVVIPFLFGFTTATNWQGSLLMLVVPIILTMTYLVPAMALLQNRAPPRHRATVSAILLFVLNLIGLGLGPLAVGMISDALTPAHGTHALGYALRWLTPFVLAAFALQTAAAFALRREARRRPSAEAL